MGREELRWRALFTREVVKQLTDTELEDWDWDVTDTGEQIILHLEKRRVGIPVVPYVEHVIEKFTLEAALGDANELTRWAVARTVSHFRRKMKQPI